MIRKQEALDYHSQGRRGKIEVVSSKPCATQRDLSLAYTPGVAEPCREIAATPDDVYRYTAKGNLVAVISNGTAVLGLGDIGALAGKPVMEGKGVLFKRFGDIDVFDIELNTHNSDEIIKAVQLLEPTFGGINLEDIKAPECFYIEESLKKTMNIPVFHDDQHGTAIISGAALLNALEVVGKKIGEVRVVFSGAGAAGIACAKLYERLGVKRENMVLVDTKGVVYKGRKEGMNPYKEYFASETKCRTLAEAMKGADMFCGVSAKGILSQDMVRSMAPDPIVFAMANPDPEITYEEATQARSDIIMATGRSDYPNQVNNVLGFPFIFRGALDVRAAAINDDMKIAATMALAKLAKEDVPDSVIRAYGGKHIEFGKDYIIPKPFDPRVLLWVAPAVAKAAMDSGVARQPIRDFDAYRDSLEARLGRSREVMRFFIHKAQTNPKRIVFPEGEEDRILRAAQVILDEKIAHPVLLGSRTFIRQRIADLGLDLEGIQIVNPNKSPRFDEYVTAYYAKRQRKGMTRIDAERQMKTHNIFGMMMVDMEDADGLISGMTQHYPDTVRPALQIIGTQEGVKRVSGAYMMVFNNQTLFIADATVNIEPNAEELAEIALLTAEKVREFDIVPRVAMLSFSNFGSAQHPLTLKVRRAVEIVRAKDPDLIVDGEMMADTAVSHEIMSEHFPFSKLTEPANVLICPDLTSANIAYKLLGKLGGATAIGPILMGIRKPVYLLAPGIEVTDIVNMTAMAVFEAQREGEQQEHLSGAASTAREFTVGV
ncbi:MAG: malic enzyme [Ignavibacteria bacterium RIFCSPLOWO2_02_FULL_55_14]|nr:MAG: malic enzyme [Ignavibacteria bacterium GWC2_56_12]OGU63853.1 MAG: malic enzyme [Ignavibacteria bacterium RIFCSPHIGHO2_02_FULL_56_12]OGU69920.1 MAG: malic enzyme [Ignavibacteria bacterium RIFCSPLOWO2_02_FULL_55_14]HAV22782.1 NADP-dependent malic enzyme [Bacteroidota bacterium]